MAKMKIFCGSFQPELAKLFCKRVLQAQKDSLAPILVVVPSQKVAEVLQNALLGETGIVANLTFHNFLSLANELTAGEDINRLVSDSGFLNYALKDVLANSAAFSKGVENKDFVRGFAATLADLRDGDVPVSDDTILSEEKALEDKNRILDVLDAYKKHSRKLKSLNIGTYDELFNAAEKNIESSSYLKQFGEIMFFGFYNLTELQLKIFTAIRDNYPSVLFYPLESNKAYEFAKEYFSARLQSSVAEVENVASNPEDFAIGNFREGIFETRKSPPEISKDKLEVVSVSGTRDELWYAVKEILKLVDNGYRYEDIAVIARTLEPYKNDFSVFTENRIPIQSPVEVSILNYPLAYFVLELFTLNDSDFFAERVLKVISSPFFEANSKTKSAWKVTVKRLGITQGWHQWSNRLSFESVKSLKLGKFEEKTIVTLKDTLSKIKKDLNVFEGENSWKEFSRKAKNILFEYLNVENLNSDDRKVLEHIVGIFDSLEKYDLISYPRKGEFLGEFVSRLESLTLSPYSESNLGVKVLDVMSARANFFKVVFLLGLNEKLFPRLIREDSFLLDSHRKTLNDTLGYWVGEKLDGYDEEKLLFYLTVSSASEKLFCVYQRSDYDGKTMVPSLYLSNLCNACGFSLYDSKRIEIIPRQNGEKLKSIEPKYLSHGELSLLVSLNGQDEERFENFGIDNEIFKPLRKFSNTLSKPGAPGDIDGIVGSVDEHLDYLKQKGLSSSGLESVLQCPLKYFFQKPLGLREDYEEVDSESLENRDLGTIYHSILKKLYEKLTPGQNPEELLRKLTDTEFLESIETKALYPVVKEALSERVLESISEFVKADKEEMNGYSPKFFEHSLSTQNYLNTGFKLQGILDRIDIHGANKTIRIVDYKRKPKKKKLITLISKGEILQPYLYMELAKELCKDKLKGYEISEVVLEGIECEDEKQRFKSLSAKDRETVSEFANKTVLTLVDLIKSGRFFINPSQNEQHSYCGWCDFKDICRKNHLTSVKRAGKMRTKFKKETGKKV
jgi:ATP-dependent helicase/nuclease subunit B